MSQLEVHRRQGESMSIYAHVLMGQLACLEDTVVFLGTYARQNRQKKQKTAATSFRTSWENTSIS